MSLVKVPAPTVRNAAHLCVWQLKAFLTTLFLLSVFLAPMQVLSEDKFSDAQVKAALLFSFFRFVEWPESYNTEGKLELTLGIIGTDPVGEHLAVLVGRKWVGGRKILIRKFSSGTDVEPTNILFIPNSERANIPQILSQIKNSSVLTVGDHKDFLKADGIIAFVTRDKKVRFKINNSKAQTENIKISNELLKLADQTL